MENSSIKPGKSDDRERLVNMSEISVRSTELVYVTAVNPGDVTFFAQQCKYTNQELVEHNQSIHEYCKQLVGDDKKAALENAPKEVSNGDVYCTRYIADCNWYRAVVKSFDNSTRRCECYFVDYGNIEDISYDDLLQVNPQNLPTIERAPFGFYCSVKVSDKLDEPSAKHLLECLMNEYVLIRAQERLGMNLWRVELPKVAYNTTFWISYQTGKTKNKKSTGSMQPNEEITTAKA